MKMIELGLFLGGLFMGGFGMLMILSSCFFGAYNDELEMLHADNRRLRKELMKYERD
jgi:hypothetical protein